MESETPEGTLQKVSWEKTLDKVAHGVVVLRVTAPRDFDTEDSGSYMGTGFIVDAKRGIILSNRHLVQPGPIVAEGVFLNHEEIDIHPIYRDPVHDFGFFKFDPAELNFTKLTELPLSPERARVGIDVRVVGNDDGEKLSILGGTLARLDRPAPEYSPVAYNDFNTFYYQAASGTSGGSSGSPVVDQEGHVIALNAGGSTTADSSFFFPLHRVKRALELIQKGEEVKRGTIQSILLFTPFDELRRLGLPKEIEAEVRKSEDIGLLVVKEVVPGGPADEVLEVGDILLKAAKFPIRDFVTLEALFDDSIGQKVTLKVIRNGAAKDLEVTVGDLHAITPNEYIEVGGSIIHPLSYQQARNFHVPVKGLYVARAGYMLGNAEVSVGSVIHEINGEAVNTLDDLWSVLQNSHDRERLRFRFSVPFDEDQDHLSVVHVDRRWFLARRCVRNAMGDWPCKDIGAPKERIPPTANSTTFPKAENKVAQKLAASLVMVDYDIPYPAEGALPTHYRGAGVVLDAKRGLVLVDRDTVPIRLGDIQITFAGTLRVPGKVEYVHPLHNFSIVSYNPALIGTTPVQSATFNSTPLKPKEKVWQVGLTGKFELVSKESKVDRIIPLMLAYPGFPAFRESNLDVVSLESKMTTVGAVIVDEKGAVRALWTSFANAGEMEMFGGEGAVFKGIPMEVIERATKPFLAGKPVIFRSLGIEMQTMTLIDALEYGLDQAHLDLLTKHPDKRRQAIKILRTYMGFPAASVLQNDDIILGVNGTSVATFSEVEALSQHPKVTLEILRNGVIKEVELETVSLDGRGVRRLVSWAGMLFHEPHLPIATQRSGIKAEGVFIAWAWSGSPATHHGIEPQQMVVEINAQPTPDLDSLLKAIKDLPNRESVRLKLVNLEGLEQLITLRIDLDYWPSWELVDDGESWHHQ